MNPYPGLRPFEGETATFFFGRDRQISELIERLRNNRFVAVVGLSGSGKSSIVRAGLLTALRAGQLGAAGTEWRIATMRPSDRPVATLAAELNKPEVLGPSPERVEILQGSTFGLLRAATVGRSRATNLLVFVDQFEDVFRLVNEGKLDATSAAHFIGLLLAVNLEPQPDFPDYVVITLRSEYLGNCSQFYGLPEALNRSQYLVPRLTPEQLQEAIEAPAALKDVSFEPALVQRLLVEASVAPDELPQLQHLLMRLWELRTGEIITLVDYRSPRIGELEQALDLHAEEVFAKLTDTQKSIAERVFQRLTAWDEGTRDARRPTGLSELAAVSGAAAGDVADIVRLFVEQDFLTEIPSTGGGEALLDITHESLIRRWKRLECWARQEARYKELFLGLAAERRPVWNEALVREAIDWRDKFKPNEVWAERYAPGRLGPSLKVLKGLEEELTAAARRKQQLLFGSIGVAIFMLILSGWAFREQSRAASSAHEALANEARWKASAAEAEIQRNAAIRNLDLANKNKVEADKAAQDALQQAKINRSHNLARAAFLDPRSDPQRALLLALYAWRTGEEKTADLIDGLRASVLGTLILHRGVAPYPLSALSFLADGTLMAAARIPDRPEVMFGIGTEPAKLNWYGLACENSSLTAASISSDEVSGVIGCSDGELVVWKGPNLHSVSHFQFGKSAIVGAAISHGRIFSADASGQLRFSEGNKVLSNAESNQPISSVKISPGGGFALTSGYLGSKIWDIKNSKIGDSHDLNLNLDVEVRQPPIFENSTFDRTGRLLIGAFESRIRLWEPKSQSTASDWIEIVSARSDTCVKGPQALAVGPQATFGAIGGGAGQLSLWDRQGCLFNLLNYEGPIDQLAFSPDGAKLAAASSDRFEIWDIKAALELAPLLRELEAETKDPRKIDQLLPLAQKRVTQKLRLNSDQCREFFQGDCPTELYDFR